MHHDMLIGLQIAAQQVRIGDEFPHIVFGAFELVKPWFDFG